MKNSSSNYIKCASVFASSVRLGFLFAQTEKFNLANHFCKEPGPGNQPRFLCLWDCVTVRNSFLLREFQEPHLQFVFLKTIK